ncbi:hypothetical protein BU26DRAFT_452517 [Trematosphaeria pertusa]|uniref:RING-type E3 ubiquitin transferase n=1 Tax=Trematosphaeria pertusa TaxID=390896 RepID=A0A6A6IPW0_9PLEO|nr:uncharacterized protein BU26DRAFT_452517 [Trematosphaeria pertusa]KAF2252299.1 hypothetical protein BU26DRAFT_452517 [Trematosphaeria pertusa]
MVVCRYFQQGRCLNGETCRFEHPSTTAQTSPSTSSLNAKAPTFDPAQTASPTAQNRAPCVFFLHGTCKRGFLCRFDHSPEAKPPAAARQDDRTNTVCTFFLRNICNKGAACPYSHATSPDSRLSNDKASNAAFERPASSTGASVVPPVQPHFKGTKEEDGSDRFSRTIGGATVRFEDGVTISTLALPSDFSVVSMLHVPPGKSVQDLRNLLHGKGFPGISVEAITLKSDPKTSFQSAQIKVPDPRFAARLLRETGHTILMDGSAVHVVMVQLGAESESGANRLQLTTVACTWHNPSKVAYVEFSYPAQAAAVVLEMQKSQLHLHGRQLNFACQPRSSWVTVGNLNPATGKKALTEFLPTAQPSYRVNMGQLSHEYSAERLEFTVKSSLEQRGTLAEWTATPQSNGSKVKAIAKFADPEAARKAVQELNDTLIDPSSKDKLKAQHLVAVKLSVSQRVLQAIKPQLDALVEEARVLHFVSIKIYDNPEKAYTQIRVSGQDREAVARVKSSVERTLAGRIAGDGSVRISHSFFFQEASTAFLAEVMRSHGVTIVSDRRKLLLRLYGDTLKVLAAEQALTEKLSSLETQSKVVVLDPISLNAALRGGFRLIVATLGKEMVKMDITSNPKRIIVYGSDRHVAQVEELLRSYDPDSLETRATMLSLNAAEEEELCPVCWTPPEDPFKTKCGHTYCSSCLASQCTTATDFPLRCLGASAACNALLTLLELKQVLSSNDYEALLQTSFTQYIRSHPTSFQYCSTPDCDRFYRITLPEDPGVFNCDGCLTSICTACHQIAHDGITCAASKAAHVGTSEFAKWKEENDARDCPNCGTPIQKSYGCNHMECQACRTHICWFCMKTFKTGEDTYGHMAKAHNGIRGMGLGF